MSKRKPIAYECECNKQLVELQKQLEEKDKEIEELKKWQEWYSIWHENFKKQIEDLTTELETYRPTKLHGNGQCKCFNCNAINWTDWCSQYKGHIYCNKCLKDILKEEQTSQTQLAEKDCRIEELEGQFAYECECNKQLVELQKQIAETEQEFFVFREDSSRNEQIYIRELAEKQKRLAELEQELAELKEKAIVPKFKVGQEVWYVYNKYQRFPFRCVIDKIVYDSSKNYKFRYDTSNELYIGVLEKDLFATEQEAQAKLQELRGGE